MLVVMAAGFMVLVHLNPKSHPTMAEYGAFYRDAGHVTVEKIVNFSLGQGSGRTHITEGVWEALGALKGFRRLRAERA